MFHDENRALNPKGRGWEAFASTVVVENSSCAAGKPGKGEQLFMQNFGSFQAAS